MLVVQACKLAHNKRLCARNLTAIYGYIIILKSNIIVTARSQKWLLLAIEDVPVC